MKNPLKFAIIHNLGRKKKGGGGSRRGCLNQPSNHNLERIEESNAGERGRELLLQKAEGES